MGPILKKGGYPGGGGLLSSFFDGGPRPLKINNHRDDQKHRGKCLTQLRLKVGLLVGRMSGPPTNPFKC